MAFSLQDPYRAAPLGRAGAGPGNAGRLPARPGKIRDALSARCRRHPSAALSGAAGAPATDGVAGGRQVLAATRKANIPTRRPSLTGPARCSTRTFVADRGTWLAWQVLSGAFSALSQSRPNLDFFRVCLG